MTTTATIGGREYTITPLKIKASRAWREQLNTTVDSVAQAFNTRITDPAGLKSAIDTAKRILIGMPDFVLHLVGEYAPNIAADAEWIEENGTDAEVFAVFVEVLKLAYPLGSVTTLMSGLAASTTSTSSASQNTAKQ